MTEGFIRLSRKTFSHYLWTEDRAYSRLEAWVDLIQLASFKQEKRIIKGSSINVPRGGIVATERFLSDRWKWSRTKARAFLDLLREDSMIRQEKDQEYTVIILCNYESYNSAGTTEKPQKNRKKTSGEPAEDQREEDKEDKEDKEDIPDPRSAPVTAGFCEAFEEIFGTPYVHNGGRDGKRLKLFLAITPADKFPAESIIRVAKAAMKRSGEPFAKATKFANSLQGFCDHFNSIRAELNGSVGTGQVAGAAAKDAVSAQKSAAFNARPLSPDFRQWQAKQSEYTAEKWETVGDVPEFARSEFKAANPSKKIYQP